ncbi:MAG: methylenetetrahydrofolate--tRNA-(uracil(54)-C(5))-methyltransferase (FADH(2)-oxidizing) TrmFO [Candidatus Krumholzibacteriota bacterium]|nr:methylenetetrahydrofolate--tRNA-(uracil(54)-C(5))-methyltransferase (FADH(2)-oxidizing) TrmFO [Candidatus Krumholzibacteriota bacterium]
METTVVGGGLAGSEAALQLAARGITVRLLEMRPVATTPAHRTGDLAELVCSNSLKSEDPSTASGLLKAELRLLGCRLLDAAASARVPAGHALAVDREVFSRAVTEMLETEPLVTVERLEQTDLDLPPGSIVATGPLTSPAMADAIGEAVGRSGLFFYDAISISVSADSIDRSVAWAGSRYDRGGDDYLNLPFEEEEYERLVRHLREAPKTTPRGFEEGACFDACLPVETIASRGEDALRFGPLKPRGLADPRTGQEPFAVLQLRRETLDGSMLGLVGFQTRLTRPAQRELLELIPGLAGAEILRWGAMHRNTYLDSPRLLDDTQAAPGRDLFFAGQLAGVEGYVESIAHGLVAAMNASRRLAGRGPFILPPETITGALQRHLAAPSSFFQPMNANFGLLQPVRGPRRERRRRKSERSLEALKRFLSEGV